ncbi:hypothetical protein ZWY2020_041848 [Hordeum vulgare]|nr:hypothetical protein ZWY2020_041848 [Hordeum vulgare]
MDASAAADGGHRWTEEVDDLVDAGDVDGAISLLRSVVSSLSTAVPTPPPPGADLRLATALSDLQASTPPAATPSRPTPSAPAPSSSASAPERSPQPQSLGNHATAENSTSAEAATGSKDSKAVSAGVEVKDEDEDDERDLDDKGLIQLEVDQRVIADEKDNKDAARRFGTRHALVLYDFPPSTRTTDLERIFEKFGDHGVAIRWVNDSVAPAVFRTPSSGNFVLTVISDNLSACFFIYHDLETVAKFLFNLDFYYGDVQLMRHKLAFLQDTKPRTTDTEAKDIGEAVEADRPWDGAKAVHNHQCRRGRSRRRRGGADHARQAAARRCLGRGLRTGWLAVPRFAAVAGCRVRATSCQAAPRPCFLTESAPVKPLYWV